MASPHALQGLMPYSVNGASIRPFPLARNAKTVEWGLPPFDMLVAIFDAGPLPLFNKLTCRSTQ